MTFFSLYCAYCKAICLQHRPFVNGIYQGNEIVLHPCCISDFLCISLGEVKKGKENG